MKVLNLQCADQHGFEGWFGSEDDFQSQLARGLVACPLCGNTAVHKLPSAPRLNLRGGASPSTAAVQTGAPNRMPPSVHAVDGREGVSALAVAPTDAAQAAFLKAVREVLQNTDDVGGRFAEEARRMHYGETESRNIRGQTSPHEAVALNEEGIDVMSLPLPDGLKHTLQ